MNKGRIYRALYYRLKAKPKGGDNRHDLTRNNALLCTLEVSEYSKPTLILAMWLLKRFAIDSQHKLFYHQKSPYETYPSSSGTSATFGWTKILGFAKSRVIKIKQAGVVIVFASSQDISVHFLFPFA